MFHDKYQLNSIAGSPVKCFLLSLFAVFMSVSFIITKPINAHIRYDEAVVYNEIFGETVVCELRSGRSYLIIDFTLQNGEQYSVDTSCTHDGIIAERLEKLRKGDRISFAVNPDTGNILEIKCGDEEILDFDYSQSQINSENKVYFFIGIAIGVVGIYLLIHAITLVVPRRKKHRRRKRR